MTIQVVLDETQLRATDQAARKAKPNRSALIREALRNYLRAQKMKEFLEQDRVGYPKHPASDAELWEAEAAWLER